VPRISNTSVFSLSATSSSSADRPVRAQSMILVVTMLSQIDHLLLSHPHPPVARNDDHVFNTLGQEVSPAAWRCCSLCDYKTASDCAEAVPTGPDDIMALGALKFTKVEMPDSWLGFERADIGVALHGTRLPVDVMRFAFTRSASQSPPAILCLQTVNSDVRLGCDHVPRTAT